MNHIQIIKLLVKKILEQPTQYEWELKGIGLIRTYLNDDLKLHVWDKRCKVENVSMIHEHPWSFESLIVAGQLQQFRYFQPTDARESNESHPYYRCIVQCGPGGCLQGKPEQVRLVAGIRECYHEGQIYTQENHEIHQSLPEDGTVTLVRRLAYKPERSAYVYWFHGENWVSSEPRVAQMEEIIAITSNALKIWF